MSRTSVATDFCCMATAILCEPTSFRDSLSWPVLSLRPGQRVLIEGAQLDLEETARRLFIPGDRKALAGFDDIPLARFVHPSLTTMQVSIAELGDRAMTRLMQLMDGTSTDGTGDKQTLVPRLIVRDSTTPPSGR